MTYTIKSRETGKTYTITTTSEDDFLSTFYGGLEEPEVVDGIYLVDEESIQAVKEESPECIEEA
jgi:hypothetical protein